MDVMQEARNEIQQTELLSSEVAVLGSMLIDDACIPDVMLKVVPEHFVHKEYRHLFEAIRDLWHQEQPVDPVTVLDAAGQQYRQMIMEIMQVTPTAANVMKYAELLQKQSQLHRIQALASGLLAADRLEDAREISEKIYQLLSDRQDLRITSWRDGLKDFWDRQRDQTPPRYLPWGLPALDTNLTAELGDFIILGAWPSSGKTAIALQFAMHMASKGYRVGFFSLETKDKKLVDRIVAQNSSVSLYQIKHKRLRDSDWDQLVKTVVPTANYPVEIIRAAAMTVSDIQSITMSRRYQIIVVDYIQLIKSSGYSRADEVARISMGLHEMCQRIDVCVIGLSQLSRPDKTLKRREPTMQDLRETGQLEQDAEIIMLLNSADDPDRKLIIDKNKDGSPADVPLVFDANHVRFGQRAKPDYEDDEDEEPPRRRHQGARSKR